MHENFASHYKTSQLKHI